MSERYRTGWGGHQIMYIWTVDDERKRVCSCAFNEITSDDIIDGCVPTDMPKQQDACPHTHL